MDQYTYRQLCGRFATGVVIVTARDGDGAPCGMTANSFASVSLDPPLISIAVGHEATIHPLLLGTRIFAVSILESRQESLSRRFASGLPDRFEGVGWHEGPEGQVLLDGALAHLHCEKWSEVPAGDHSLFLGRVTGGSAAEHGRPLLFYRSGYADPDGL